jgi:hypothetical protein
MNPNLIPPTPTLMPMATAQVAIQSSSYRIWKFTDDAIMLWQWATPARTQVIQVAILMLILIAFAFLAIKWIQSLTNEGNL